MSFAPANEAADAWSLDHDGLSLLASEIALGRSNVIECGSGASTVVMARALRELSRGSVTALEQDPQHAEHVQSKLAAEGLEGWARVVHAPLTDDPLAQPGCRWYSAAALDELPTEADLLLVDGPVASPGSGAERSRYPALERLRDRLADGCLVVLDDAHRDGERWVIERWRELGLDMRLFTQRIAAGRIPG